MPVRRTRRWFLGSSTTLALVATAVVLTAPDAEAEPVDTGKGSGSAQQTGGGGRDGIFAAARIQYSGSVAPGGGTGNVTSADVNWDPPPCWYAPYLGAKDFKKKMSADLEKAAGAPGMTGHAGAAIGQTRAHYEDGFGWEDNPGYEDYNVDKDGKGMFWAGVENPDEPDVLKRSSCTDLPFWVDNGEAPPARYPEAITPEILAALAYQHMQLPDTEVSLAPAQATKVNLPTWTWLDKAVFDEVQATAAINVPGFALQATTTAKPVSLKLEPGTPDAETYPPPANASSTPTDPSVSPTPRARRTGRRPAASGTSARPETARSTSRPPSPGTSPGPAPAARAETCRTGPSGTRRPSRSTRSKPSIADENRLRGTDPLPQGAHHSVIRRGGKAAWVSRT